MTIRSMEGPFRVALVEAMEEVSAEDWNRLAGSGDPFIRHEFLLALERNGCVGREMGWIPRHLVVYDRVGRLVGAAPSYEKLNSYGELVFDGSWASAYQRAGLPYYPKLVIAIPYTPVTGPRLLVAPCDPRTRGAVADTLVRGAIELARQCGLSSVHCLFGSDENTRILEKHGLLRRAGVQFHWHNQGYRDFQDFLERLSAQKRKKVNRERRRVCETGLSLEAAQGTDLDDSQWSAVHRFYCSTFERRGGIPTLSLDFFREIARTMGKEVVVFLASHRSRPVAAAFCMRGADALYGRHWGCDANFHSLHFETCYYQGIEYCIRHGLKRFEPGAQGEYKLSRGFEPRRTWSAHWIAHERFRTAIDRFLRHETEAVAEYIEELNVHTPYKASAALADTHHARDLG